MAPVAAEALGDTPTFPCTRGDGSYEYYFLTLTAPLSPCTWGWLLIEICQCAPLAQFGQSYGLLIRRSWVQIPQGAR